MKRKKIGEYLLLILVTIGFLALFAFLLWDYRGQCENYVKESQQKNTDRIAITLESIVEQGQTSEQIIDCLEAMAEPTNTNYAIVFHGEEIVFLKDRITTQGNRLTKEELLSRMDPQKIIETRQTVQSGSYTVMQVSSRKNAVYHLGLDTFYMYLALLVFVSVILAFCHILSLIARNHKLAKQITAKTAEVKQALIKEEQLHNQLVEEREQRKEQEHSSGQETNFNLDLVNEFLRKSKDEALFPFQIMVIRLYLGNRYFSKGEIDQIKVSIQNKLNPNQLLCEIGKGEFCVLLYRTSVEEAQKLKRTLTAEWRMDEKLRHFYIKSGIGQIGDTETDAKAVFENTRTEVWRRIMKGTHHYEV